MDYKYIIEKFTALDEIHLVTVRMRIVCSIYRNRKHTKNQKEKIVEICEKTKINNENKFNDKQKIVSNRNVLMTEESNEQLLELYNYFGETQINEYELYGEYQTLNEVLLHRGYLQGMIQLNLHIDHHKITTIQSDGLIISTPTGSTAYSVSAGGSLISPDVPCVAITPICPHTLSFRPVVVADSALIYITVPWNARQCPELSYDGRPPIKLEYGDILVIRQSKYPVSTFKKYSYQGEWFSDLVEKFNWNVRELQKPILNKENLNSYATIKTIKSKYSDL